MSVVVTAPCSMAVHNGKNFFRCTGIRGSIVILFSRLVP